MKPHADVSTHAPFASAAAKNLYVHSPLKTSANGFKPFTNTVSKTYVYLDRTFNYNTHRAKELLQLFLEYPDIHFHLEIHPALLSEELKEELKQLPQGLLHLEAGIQSLREPVLEQSHRMGKLSDALKGLKFLCSLPNMETHADLIAGLPLYHLYEY